MNLPTLGGVNYTEWGDARNVARQTTLLSLGHEVGQVVPVVSMTHPEIPGLHGTCNVTGTLGDLGQWRFF